MKSRNWNPYYSGAEWRSLSRHVKRRDCYQCQICGDRRGDPHCILHAHHITPRASGGQNALENLITLCDLCHADDDSFGISRKAAGTDFTLPRGDAGDTTATL